MTEANEIVESVPGGWDQVPATPPAYDVAHLLELDFYLRGSYLVALLPLLWLILTAVGMLAQTARAAVETIGTGLVMVIVFISMAGFLASRQLLSKLFVCGVDLIGGVFLMWVALAQEEGGRSHLIWYCIGSLCCLPGVVGSYMQYHYQKMANDAVMPKPCRAQIGRLFRRAVLRQLLAQACLAAQQPQDHLAAWDHAERSRP